MSWSTFSTLGDIAPRLPEGALSISVYVDQRFFTRNPGDRSHVAPMPE
jgi:hypothetical protein